MGQIKVASRYAKSLLDLAQENKASEAVKADVLLVASAITENKDLELLLKSPIIREDKKVKILSEIFNEKISPLTLQFIQLLAKKGRESLLLEICNSFTNLYRKANDIQKLTIISAVKLDESTKKEILSRVQPDGMTLEIEEQINPELIGGFIVKLDDKQIDASVLGSFRKLKKDFKNNPFVANF
ncbi:ATP synthase F1 subunit delta [Luteibaculum oceani]|uniref:ATP synthase subunit delta n=1 Tax=Luteibaculum oceani TaxID=1294296 RepID=A0A5C6VPQ4_9FLAO|nr:ATP synthase F1 subunit delta [Luteibaculum oceani]TXC85288.1 ATP synthase F1 subunit delta [Luteibaculum oceani]